MRLKRMKAVSAMLLLLLLLVGLFPITNFDAKKVSAVTVLVDFQNEPLTGGQSDYGSNVYIKDGYELKYENVNGTNWYLYEWYGKELWAAANSGSTERIIIKRTDSGFFDFKSFKHWTDNNCIQSVEGFNSDLSTGTSLKPLNDSGDLTKIELEDTLFNNVDKVVITSTSSGFTNDVFDEFMFVDSYPGAPTAVSATAGDASATVSFTAPSDNGGSAITSYTVVSYPDGLTASGPLSPINISGLTNGTAYTFKVKATNAVGTGQLSAASNSVTPDAPPSGGTVSINSGAANTNSTAVTLTLSATGAAQMKISEDSGFSGASYEPYATSKNFTLSSGDGTKTVYVKYKSVTGLETSETISDSINLDTTPPTGGSISINNGDVATKSTAATLTLAATDATDMIISESSSFSGASYEPYASSKSFTLSTGDGTKTVYVKYKDIAGNETSAISDTINLDTTAPTGGSISINGGSAYTTSTAVTLTLAATDATDMIISEDSGFSGASYEAYATSKSFTLSTGDGTKTVYVKYKDALGNETAPISDTIILATTPPTGSISINSSAAYTNSTAVTLTLSSSTAVQVMMSEDSGFAGASYEAYAASKSFTLSTGDGTKAVYVKYKDIAGNESATSISDTIILDTTPPTGGSITINSGDAATNSTAATLTLAATDATDMIISESSSFSGASYEPYIASKSFTLSTGDGTKTVYVKYKDAAGNETTAVNDTITLDTTAPTGGSISINGGSAYTTSTAVNLTLAATGASEMVISEDSGFAGASYEAYAASKSFTLSTGDGTKTVYVKYKDAAGNETTAISDTIILATTPPTGTISINSSAAYTNSTAVTLTLSSSTAVQVMMSEDSGFAGGSYEAYAASKSFTLSTGDGTKTVYVKYKDIAGNESATAISDTIILDTTAPTGGSISINSGDAATSSTAVTLTLAATDATDMIISENSSFAGASYEPYATSKSFTLSTGDGTKTVYVKYKDAAGNETAAVNDTITLDTTAPTGGSISINAGAAYATSTAVTLTLAATDASDMMISEDSAFVGASYEVYATSKSFTLSTGDGTKTVYVKYKDALGNETTAISDTIILATTPPTGTISINSSEAYTNSTAVTLTLSSSTATQVMMSEDSGFAGGSYEAYAASKSFNLSSGDATKTVYVKYKDVAGNESATAISDTIILDTTAPTATIVAGSTAGGDAYVSIDEKAAGFSVVAKSSEAIGKLYVVPSTTAKNFTAITGAAIGNAISAGTGVDTIIAISANNSGVTNGTVYKVYTIDDAGNISDISTDIAFTADLAAPVPGGSGVITTNGLTSTEVALNWTKAVDNISAQNTLLYSVFKSESNNLDTVAQAIANGTAVVTDSADINTAAITGLTEGHTYYFNILVKDTLGNVSCYSKTQVYTPAPVSTLSAAAGNGQVTLTFPALTGATGIVVEKSEDGAAYSIAVISGALNSSSTNAVVTGLTNGQLYYFRLIVTGGAYAGTSNVVTAAPFTMPGAPTGISAVASNTSAQVSFTVPANNGGSAITSYTVTSNPGGITTTGTTSPIIVSGLTNGVSYTFTVKATNAAGTGPASAASNSVIPQVAAPLAPTISATVGDKQVTLNWNTVAGAAYYKIYESTTSGSYSPIPLTTVVGSVYNVTGLNNGTTYYFVVKATNAGGDSSISNEVNAIPQITIAVPAAPALTATAGNGQVTLNWNTVSGATYYKIFQSNTAGSYSSIPVATVTSSVYNIAGLSNGTTYYFVVKAVNAGGDSIASNEVNARPYAPSSGGTTTPSTPSQIRIIVGGVEQKIDGTIRTSTENGKEISVVVIDSNKLKERLDKEGQKAVVTIPVAGKSDLIKTELNGQIVKSMEVKEATVEIKTVAATYKLPASQINIDAVSSEIGKQVELKDIKVTIEISKSSAETTKIVENSAKKGEFTIVAAPIDFNVTCVNGSKVVNVQKFNSYVERTIPIPDGIDPKKITTGVVVEVNGAVRHVPTQVMVNDGKYYARINSLTNSTYSVIYHPKTFADVATHWSKEYVNEMGSRLVINGVDEKTFQPDRAITRAEFAAIVVRALGLKEEGKVTKFSDVKEADWFNGSVAKALEYGIINGYEDGTFKPEKSISREEAMAMIARAMKIASMETNISTVDIKAQLAKFNDAEAVDTWAAQSVAACIKNEVVTGNGAKIMPNDNITRAETATIITRMLQKAKLI